MLILGVDPGTAITGYGLVRVQGNKLDAVSYGCIRTDAGLPLHQRLQKINSEISRLIREFKPTHFAIEELFFNKNTRTALSVGQARGVALLAAANAGLEIAEYTPLQVKQAVVGYGRADKNQVQYMVKTILCLPEIPKPDDTADALAVAICHSHFYKMEDIFLIRGK
ncbi:crossover junction endodeoxyribonuclease RuvC [Thermincola ferriacetica]|uniref:Crossover junction endodeoxyribonuclease RuvC n=1 Tax=Thermincola ferriacetica TaxID=281456 RepID=A0A0L6W655_9FIRM|nr:crossover junction endodeoxyribonuclease RuvC [Thermincola ferriacetica]KNZ71062.1 crossover junction endodeoxyribonuclease RuvC [Thermincola ferriacetica]